MSEINTEERNLAFSQDVKATIRLWMADPDLQKLVFEAIEEGPAESTNAKLGYCNIGTKEAPEWKTLFGATNREKKIGEKGLFYTAAKTGHPLTRMRHQKAQNATTSTPKDEAKTMVSAADISLADLAASLNMTEAEVLKMAGASAAKPEPQKTDGGYEVPASVKAIIDKARL